MHPLLVTLLPLKLSTTRIARPSCMARFESSKFFQTNAVAPSPDRNTTSGEQNKSPKNIAVIIVPIVIVALLLFIIAFCFYIRRKKRLECVEDVGEITTAESLNVNFATVAVATENFSDAKTVLLQGLAVSNYGVSATGGYFYVQHKFAGQQRSLNTMKQHDLHRHQRFLYSVDIPLGGDGKPTGTGLYFTKLKIGSPSKDYYVNVDNGSDLFWVNCIDCSQCPSKSSLGVELTLYDPSKSSTSQTINCDNNFCTSMSNGPVSGCNSGLRCEYQLSYGDGSTTAGYFVRDIVQYDRVSGNSQSTPANSSIVLGCSAQQTGKLQDTDTALDGIVGFGQAESSLFSQIAATGSVKKMFAHCLDGKNGGGIFAMGNIVQPIVTTTPLLPNMTHYNVNLQGIFVGGKPLQLPPRTSPQKETIIDSGTTLAYLPGHGE